MTERHRSIPLTAIRQHTTLQNRNTTSSMRRGRREAEQRVDHVARLAQSIEAKGLETPLELVAMTNTEAKSTGQLFWLVGGHHRMAALQLLERQEADAIILEGEGLHDARKQSYLQNAELFRQLEDDQRIDNAWRAINDPVTDDFRGMTNKTLATTFNITTRTIDRMHEVRRRWAAQEQDIDYEVERSKAKEQGQRGIRAFNQELDIYCNDHLMGLFGSDYGRLKRELERGTEVATLEQRQLIARTVATVMQGLNAHGLEDVCALRSVLKQIDNVLARAKSYHEACDIADARYLDSSSANLERFIRQQEVAPMLHSVLAPIDEKPDF
jgi:hypothetical protein